MVQSGTLGPIAYTGSTNTIHYNGSVTTTVGGGGGGGSSINSMAIASLETMAITQAAPPSG